MVMSTMTPPSSDAQSSQPPPQCSSRRSVGTNHSHHGQVTNSQATSEVWHQPHSAACSLVIHAGQMACAHCQPGSETTSGSSSSSLSVPWSSVVWTTNRYFITLSRRSLWVIRGGSLSSNASSAVIRFPPLPIVAFRTVGSQAKVVPHPPPPLPSGRERGDLGPRLGRVRPCW